MKIITYTEQNPNIFRRKSSSLPSLQKCSLMFCRYHGSSGLLKSKMDQSGSYLYEYDTYGRLVKAVLPTGEALGLQFNLTSQGAAIDLMKNQIMSQVVLVQDQLISKRPFSSDLRRHVVSVSSDKTLVSRRPDGLGLTIGTIPHPVIGVMGDPVMAASFPMPGELRTFMGTNLISTFGWKYSLATGGSSAMMGIRKTLRVNNEDLLTVFYDKLQKRQILYSLTSSSGGKEQLLEVRYDSQARPLIYEAAAFASLSQSYDIFGNLQQWDFGGLSEAFKYDQNGRLTAISRGNSTYMTYQYKDAFDVLPKSITMGTNSHYRYE